MDSNYKRYYILILLFMSSTSLLANSSGTVELCKLDSTHENSKDRWGIGAHILLTKYNSFTVSGLYTSQLGNIWQITAGSSFSYQLEYQNGSSKTKYVSANSYHFSIGISIPVNKPTSSLFFQTELFSKLFRSEEVFDWVEFDHLIYQKRFDHYFDMNLYGLRAGLRWMPKLSGSTFFDISMAPEFFYFNFPDKRQSDPLYIYPVRDTMFGGKTSKNDKYRFGFKVQFGIIFTL